MVNLDVTVVPTGTANLASVEAGLRRVGAEPRLARDAGEVRDAERVVLPGVGTLGAAMQRLRHDGLVEILAQRVQRGAPTLAICLGLQLLCEASDESPGEAGLGVLPGRVTRFPDGLKVPQLGWNRITPARGCRLLQPGHVYFANSFRLSAAPTGWRPALAEYGGPFVAALERGAVLACQFHPELSGPAGLALLRRWLDLSKGGTSCSPSA